MHLVITLGKRHDESWEVIHGPEVAPDKQVSEFRALLTDNTHPKFQRVEIHRLVPGAHQYLKRFAPAAVKANEAGEPEPVKAKSNRK
jgi:hypothetical protein